MFEPLNGSLKKIARGTGFAIVGMALGMFLGFITRLIIARYGLQANYGIFSLALVVLNLAVTISTLGLRRGATRYIAYFRAKGEGIKIGRTVSASLQLSVVASIIICLALFFTADAIAVRIFHTPELASPLKIFAIGIPFLTLINVLVAFFRGFDRVEPRIYFQNITLNILFLILLSITIAIGLPFVTVFYSYLAALIITFIALSIYTAKRLPQRIGLTDVKDTTPITKELLLFSLPLFAASILTAITMEVDTLMLGYFKTLEIVGLYNAVYPLASVIFLPLWALRLIYTPVATGLYSRNLMPELRRNYTVVTKWLASITLPIFLVLAINPGAVLYLFFGHGYAQAEAAMALRILSIGFIFSTLLGPNGATLISLGRTRFIMLATLAATIMNVILNIILIPPLGIVGAAIASVVSITVVNIINLLKLYSLCKAQPLSKNLLKPLIISIVLAVFIQVLAQNFLTITLWILPLLFILYYSIYVLAMLFTRSFDKEDIALLLEIANRSGISVTPIKKILSRFL